MIHGLAGKQISTQGGLSAEISEIPLIFLSKLLSFKKSYLNKFKPQLKNLESAFYLVNTIGSLGIDYNLAYMFTSLEIPIFTYKDTLVLGNFFEWKNV